MAVTVSVESLGPGLGPDTAELEADDRCLATYGAGDRVASLAAIHSLYRALRQSGRPWALEAARVWLTGLVQAEGLGQRALARAVRARRALEASGRLDWVARALAQEGRLLLLAEDWNRASILLDRACDLGLRSGVPVPPMSWASLWVRRGHVLWGLGRIGEARAAWEAALDTATGAGLPAVAAACHANLSLCLWAQGEPAAGYVHASTALNWYRRNGRRTEAAHSLYNAALMLEDFGHWRDATILLYEARDLAVEIGDGDRVADTCIELVHAYVALGRVGDARLELAEAWRASRTARPPFLPRPARHAELCVAEGHICLARHRPEEALALLRRATALVGNASRPLLTRRVARHLNLAIQSGGGRLKTVTEMTAIIQAISASGGSGSESLLASPERN